MADPLDPWVSSCRGSQRLVVSFRETFKALLLALGTKAKQLAFDRPPRFATRRVHLVVDLLHSRRDEHATSTVDRSRLFARLHESVVRHAQHVDQRHHASSNGRVRGATFLSN